MQVAILGNGRNVLTFYMQLDSVKRMIQRSALDHWERERMQTMEKGAEIQNKVESNRD